MTRILLAGSALLVFAFPVNAQKGPAPAAAGLAPEVIAQACIPRLTDQSPAVPLRVTGGQDSAARIAYAPGDLVTINAGTRNGIAVGQEFYTRRSLARDRQRITPNHPGVIRTTGWIRVWAVDDDLSLATITHACETVNVDDYLEPFSIPGVPVPISEAGPAQRDNYGRVVVGQDRRTALAQGDYLIVDRGTEHGVVPGTRFVLYHDKRVADNFLFQVGEAFAVDVQPASSTLRVMTAIDAIREGDYVAIRK